MFNIIIIVSLWNVLMKHKQQIKLIKQEKKIVCLKGIDKITLYVYLRTLLINIIIENKFA